MLFIVAIALFSSRASAYGVGGIVNLYFNASERCHVRDYDVNYKPITLEVYPLENIQYILISDQHVESCDQGCPKGALYCSFGLSKIIKEQISVCIDKIYVHLYPKTMNKMFATTLKTEYLVDIPCNDINRNPTNFCQLLSDDECIDDSTGCGLLTCQKKHNIENTNIFSMCLPDSTPKDELNRRCLMHSEANTYDWEFYKTPESEGNWLIWVIISILLVTLLFGGIVVYYQRMYQKHGRPPFRVSKCCPKRLFPRKDEDEAWNMRVIQ
ncbi:hypothetical protein SteCoe_18823 [Stentor coeruleus]|uniref:Uncharacterized protein n=1 Tax=Stentor coeruleus TaxID=5963 RepID=A0A1R2BVI6_9CILI|nr:hypothetical protein SteCoe_18823 [Stentor coeruleus]